jgi:hypothetical protein
MVAAPDHPSRTRAFIAISLGLVPPACAIHSITFLSDTLCWVEVANSTVTGSARSSITNCCSLMRFSPRAAASMVVSAWTVIEWSMSRTSRNVTRLPEVPWGTAYHNGRTKGEHDTILK